MPKYIIHACLDRQWYVEDFLIPSMTEQGIPEGDIEVWLDKDRDGCLFSCMKCFSECGKRGSGRWHLQDDVVISKDFAKKTAEHDEGVVTGFFHGKWERLTPMAGKVPAIYMWNSFQCIRIPDALAGECAEWFFNDAIYRDKYKEWVESNKCDDSFWRDFFLENHVADEVTNLRPSIVDHIDFMIGGSVINKWRGHPARGDYFEDNGEIEELKNKLAAR